jgi:hypothetical protein
LVAQTAANLQSEYEINDHSGAADLFLPDPGWIRSAVRRIGPEFAESAGLSGALFPRPVLDFSPQPFTGRGLTHFHGEKQTAFMDPRRRQSAVCP